MVKKPTSANVFSNPKANKMGLVKPTAGASPMTGYAMQRDADSLGAQNVIKPKLSGGSATGATSALTGLFGNPKRFANQIMNMAPGKFAEMMKKMGARDQ